MNNRVKHVKTSPSQRCVSALIVLAGVLLGAVGAKVALSTPVSAERANNMSSESPNSSESKHRAHESKWDGESWVIHEWGTFTAVQGSDGTTLDGLSHDEEDLPEFVYDLREGKYGRNLAAQAVKMETPVIYLYAPEERSVSLRVDFPRGVVTQWYPKSQYVNYRERKVEKGSGEEHFEDLPIKGLKDGFIQWGGNNPGWSSTCIVRPPSESNNLPVVSNDDPWRFCREVDANDLRVCNPKIGESRKIRGNVEYEYEKCLFYRGLGDFPLPLQVSDVRESVSDDSGVVSLSMKNAKPEEPLAHLFIVLMHKDRAGFIYLERCEDSLELKDKQIALHPAEQAKDQLKAKLTKALSKTGLYTNEARAMANTWNESYFKHDGLRVLYVIPSPCIDRELPLKVKNFGEHILGDKGRPISVEGGGYKMKAPAIVRTFVGRLEVMTPRLEQAFNSNIEAFAAGNEEERDQAMQFLKSWGRYSLPYLNRVISMTKDVKVQEAARKLKGQLSDLNAE